MVVTFDVLDFTREIVKKFILVYMIHLLSHISRELEILENLCTR